ncbi:MAG TPA: hypothetical protein VHJ20_00560 [Polyangia bacterium]|nr:hypothetical protein [Polyangia bacterium]
MSARKELWSTTGIAVTLVALIGSCGGGGSKPLTVSDYCDQRALKECAVPVASCLADLSDCQKARSAACVTASNAITSADAKRVFSPGNVSNCVNKGGSVYGKDTIKPADLADLDDTCGYVFQGAVALNEACTSKYDCADKNNICDKGLCAAKVVKGKDALCADPGAICSTGQYCATAGAVLKCIDKAGKGTACDANTPCLETLRCSGGTCTDLIAGGDACTADSDCVTADPFCDPYGGNLCAPGLKFATHSASCAPFGDTKAPSGAGGSTGTGGSTGAGGSTGTGGSTGPGGAGGSGGSTATGGTTGAGGSDAAVSD